MKKIVRLVIVIVTVLSLTFLSVNHVAWAGPLRQGTVPCVPAYLGEDENGNAVYTTCTAIVSVPGGGGPAGDIHPYGGSISYNEVNGVSPLGPGVRVEAKKLDGTPLYFVAPPIRICFPLYGGGHVIRRWYPADQLTEMFHQTYTDGLWFTYPTFVEDGQMCTWTYFLGLFAPF